MQHSSLIPKTWMVLLLLIVSGWIFKTFSQSPWMKLEDMPTARSMAGSCLLDGRIYVIGGVGGTNEASRYASTEAYDIALKKWTVLANMQVSRYGATYHAVNGKIYAFGGEDENTVEEYDPKEDTWTFKSTMPGKRWNHTSCVYNNEVYFFGGGDIYATIPTPTWVYNPASNTWQTMSDSTGKRYFTSCYAYNDKIYVFGGLEPSNSTKTAAYDPVSDTWEELADIPVATFGHITLLYNNKILLFGGDNGFDEIYQDGINPLKHVFEYDPENNKWKRLVDMPFTRSFMSGITSGKYIYLFGGHEEPTREIASAEVWRCDPEHVYIPDNAFLDALIDEGVDTDGNGMISYTEAEAITSLDVSGEWICNGGSCGYIRQIASLEGVEAFINLDTLLCYNNKLTSLDVSNNTALEYLRCAGNQLTSLDVSNNTALEDLILCGFRGGGNLLTYLDVSHNTALTGLLCNYNQLTSLDVSNNTALTHLWCGINQLTSLDVSNNTALTRLWCQRNQLTSLDVSGCTALTGLLCDNNQLTSLDVSNNTALTNLNCEANQLTSLDVSNNTALTNLDCDTNQLTSLDVSNNTALRWLYLSDMPTLHEVCVWEDFSLDSVSVNTSDSPNVCFETDCDGVCGGTGIEGYSMTGLSIHPNPVNNFLTIETVNSCQHTIEITSLNGQLIYRNKIEGSVLQIDLSSFRKGVYIIRVRSGDLVRTEKIIKI